MLVPDWLSDWIPLLAVIVTLVPLVALERWIHQHLHGVAYLLTRHRDAAVLLYAVPLLPGVLLHELSHWLMAKVLLVQTGKLSLWPERDRSGHIRLGSVTIERTDPVRASLVGVAPLITGSLIVLFLSYRMFGVSMLGDALAKGDLPGVMAALGATLRVPDMWLWLYLLFAVANAMLPSPSDRETWPPVLLFLAAMVGLAYVFGLAGFLFDLAPAVATGMRWLAVAFGVTLVADAPFVILIAFAEWLVTRVGGQRVYYSQPPKRKRR